MNWKERRHKRLRKRARKEYWFREVSAMQKGRWRKAMYSIYFEERERLVYART